MDGNEVASLRYEYDTVGIYYYLYYLWVFVAKRYHNASGTSATTSNKRELQRRIKSMFHRCQTYTNRNGEYSEM